MTDSAGYNLPDNLAEAEEVLQEAIATIAPDTRLDFMQAAIGVLRDLSVSPAFMMTIMAEQASRGVHNVPRPGFYSDCEKMCDAAFALMLCFRHGYGLAVIDPKKKEDNVPD